MEREVEAELQHLVVLVRCSVVLLLGELQARRARLDRIVVLVCFGVDTAEAHAQDRILGIELDGLFERLQCVRVLLTVVVREPDTRHRSGLGLVGRGAGLDESERRGQRGVVALAVVSRVEAVDGGVARGFGR
jgi:hypothetical protein